MTRITGADHILTLLRAQLARREKQRRKQHSSATQTTSAEPNAIQRLRAMASNDEISHAALARSFVQALLLEEFGEAVLNDPQFQMTVDTVHERIANDRDSGELLKRALEQILTGA